MNKNIFVPYPDQPCHLRKQGLRFLEPAVALVLLHEEVAELGRVPAAAAAVVRAPGVDGAARGVAPVRVAIPVAAAEAVGSRPRPATPGLVEARPQAPAVVQLVAPGAARPARPPADRPWR